MNYGAGENVVGQVKIPDINAIKQGANLYAYGVNNTVRYVDPSGEFGLTFIVGVTLVSGLVAAGVNFSTQMIANKGNVDKEYWKIVEYKTQIRQIETGDRTNIDIANIFLTALVSGVGARLEGRGSNNMKHLDSLSPNFIKE